jgi:hypothetical protein
MPRSGALFYLRVLNLHRQTSRIASNEVHPAKCPKSLWYGYSLFSMGVGMVSIVWALGFSIGTWL